MGWNTHPASAEVRTLRGTAAPLAADAAARTEWTDEALMQAIAARDELAFSVLYDRYVDLVYSASFRVLGDAQLAEDATQDIFVRLWRRPETFIPDRGRFLSWLMSVVRNRAVDELRARGRRLRREAAVCSRANGACVSNGAAPFCLLSFSPSAASTRGVCR